MPGLVCEKAPMAKRKKAPVSGDDRITLVNLKGSEEERLVLLAMCEETGVSLSEIVRRGVSMWAKSRKLKNRPNWPSQ